MRKEYKPFNSIPSFYVLPCSFPRTKPFCVLLMSSLLSAGSSGQGAPHEAGAESSDSAQANELARLPLAVRDELVKRIVRFLLSMRRTPAKRADVTRYVFRGMAAVASKRMTFNAALSKARLQLKKTFAMDVLQLVKPQRPILRASTVKNRKTCTAYVLVTTLPPELRVEQPGRFAEFGLLAVAASMVLLSPGCAIRQDELYRALRRVGVDIVNDKAMMMGAHEGMQGGVRKMLERDLPDQWYLTREQVDDETWYSFGVRTLGEFDDETLVGFVAAVFCRGGHVEMDRLSRAQLLARLQEARKEVCDDTSRPECAEGNTTNTITSDESDESDD